MPRRLLIISGGYFAIAFFCNSALAQITPDTTLGVQNSIITPNVNIKGSPADLIGGGASRGVNLFHSFAQFNINDGQRVYFNNPVGIENILTRVTGGTPSNIQGLLGVNGNANLFLINPNGIIFGQNAQLDIGGSFVASTANSIVFPNGYRFSTTNPQAPPLLTINVPIGLQYGAQPRAIQVQQSTLEVPTGKTLMLVGGEVNLEGANLRAPGGRVELTGVGGSGNIGLNIDGNNLRLNPGGVARANVSITNGAFVNVMAADGGNIAINAQNLNLAGGSLLLAGIESERGSVNSKAGDIEINATGAITLKEASFIINWLQEKAIDNGGNITINTGSFLLTDSSRIVTLTDSKGQGGNLTVIAREVVEVIGNPPTGSSNDSALVAFTRGAGNAGNIRIETKQLINKDGGFVYASSLGSGRAGDITVIASDSVELVGAPQRNRESGLFASSVKTGDAGNIRIETKRLLVKEGGQVTTDNVEPNGGAAGNINIIASDSVELIGVPPYANGKPTGVFTFTLNNKNAGDLNIETGSFIVRDGASVSTVTTGAGQAGNLTVNASKLVEISGTSPIDGRPTKVRAITDGSGNGGTLTINTEKLIVQGGGLLSADTMKTGRAGNLNVTATDSVQVIGTSSDGNNVSSLFFDSSGSGNAGDLRIFTGKLIVQNGGNVSASTSGQGQAGTLDVKANTVEVTGVSADGKNRSQLFFDSSGSGNAGELSIITRILTVLDGGQVSAATSNSGKGGILAVEASESVVISGKNGEFVSGLYFDSRGSGDARGISITTGNFIADNGGQVTVSGNASGIAGDLKLTANSVVLNNQAKLAASTIDYQGGSVNITAFDNINISGESSVVAEATGNGIAGGITILTNQLNVRDQSKIAVNSIGTGNAGDLNITAQEVFLNNKAKLNAETTSAIGGNINLQGLNSLTLSDKSEISASTIDGQGGNVEINAKDSISLTGNSSLFARATGSGSAGNLRLRTNQLTLQDGSQATVSSVGTGNAGNLDITALTVGLDNQAKLSAQTVSASGGNINLQGLNSLSLSNNSKISASTIYGLGGNIEINALEAVNLSSNSGVFARAIRNGVAGNLRIITNQLTLQDGAKATVSNTGFRDAGDLDITAQTVSLNNKAKLSAETTSAIGGNINLQGLNSLTLSNNSEISASTKNGQGGNVNIQAKDSINLTGNSGVFASATESGSAGNLHLSTNQFTLQDGSQATVSNTGSGGTGNLEVTANSIFLTNQANLSAKTTSGEGGNIRLQVADTVLLRHNSNILTEALGTGNGGNITINAGNFVLAILPENSDIAATAIQGRGGNIFVTAQGVFGFSLPERLVRTPESDISAASQLGINGTREINTRDVQPVPLPENPGLPETAQDCNVNRNSATGQPAQSQFYNTGRGGLPPNPSEALSTNTAIVPWVTELENPSVARSSTTPKKIVEAQSWVILPNGEVMLTESTPSVPQAGCKIRLSQP